MAIHRLGVPRAGVGVLCVQPLPWQADEVNVSFIGGAGCRCRVSRHPGDLVRVESAGLDVPAGTLAELEWTQDHQGSFAAGTVVAAPAGWPAGVYIRIDRSVLGVERRFDTRAETWVPVTLTDAYGRGFRGHAVDLSAGGARVMAELRPLGDRTRRRRRADRVTFDSGGKLVAEVMLPDGVLLLWCFVTAVGPKPGELHLSFLEQDADTVERLAAFLRTLPLDQRAAG